MSENRSAVSRHEKADSWEELIEKVDEIKEELRRKARLAKRYDAQDDDQDAQHPNRFWYRGISDSVYTLSPSLYRYRNGKEKEKLLFERFRQIQIDNPLPRKNPWEQLVSMQHYNVPTRLLDWTEVVGVAAYFATAPQSASKPCVYVLDALWLNKKSGSSGWSGR